MPNLMTSHLSIDAEAMSSGAALLRRPLRPALERRDRRQRPVVRRVRRKCVTRDGPLGGALLPPARGSVTLGRSATQDILGREPDAGVLRPHHARPTCRGWQSQRGKRTRAVRSREQAQLRTDQRAPRDLATARACYAALALPAAARRSGVTKAQHSRLRSATQDVLGRAPRPGAWPQCRKAWRPVGRATREELPDDVVSGPSPTTGA